MRCVYILYLTDFRVKRLSKNSMSKFQKIKFETESTMRARALMHFESLPRTDEIQHVNPANTVRVFVRSLELGLDRYNKHHGPSRTEPWRRSAAVRIVSTGSISRTPPPRNSRDRKWTAPRTGNDATSSSPGVTTTRQERHGN